MEFSEQDTQYASRIVERLLSNDGERADIEIEGNLVISDLEADAISFSDELEFAEHFRIGFPVVRIAGDDGYFVPVSLFSIFGVPRANIGNQYFLSQDGIEIKRFMRYPAPWMVDWAIKSLRGKENFSGFGIINPDEARVNFLERAVIFLATRIAAVRNFSEGKNTERGKWGKPASLNLSQFFGGRKVVTPGCYFSVSTNSSGLRVFWSGAYYLAPNYFSHPTTPATSVLQAGTYIFGVDGGAYGNNIEWDTNAVISLPGNPFIHLNY